jgi:hypothetical protein
MTPARGGRGADVFDVFDAFDATIAAVRGLFSDRDAQHAHGGCPRWLGCDM